MRQQELPELLAQVIQQAKDIGLEVSPRIKPEVRVAKAKSWFGYCNGTSSDWNKCEFTISISTYHLPNSKKAVRETIAHEVCHTVRGCHGHGPEWKRAAQKMNEAYGYHIQRVGSGMGYSLQVPQDLKVKHVVACTSCGKKYTRTRHSNLTLHPDWYTCGTCGGKLKLEY